MINLTDARAELQKDLGYKTLSPLWAKVEIVLGLFAIAVSISLIVEAAQVIGMPLFVLGGYLTLAGHRSHIYQSMNNHTAYLLLQIRQLKKEEGNHT